MKIQDMFLIQQQMELIQQVKLFMPILLTSAVSMHQWEAYV